MILQCNNTQAENSEKVVKTAVILQCNLTQTDNRVKVVKNGSDFTMQSYTNGQKWKSGQKRQWFHNAIIHKRTKVKK